MSLPAEHRRWLIANAIVGAAIANAILNGGIAWLSRQSDDAVPRGDVVTDSIATLFLLPLIASLIVTASVRAEQLERLPTPWAARLPQGSLARALAIAALTTALLAPFVVVLLLVVAPDDMSVGAFVGYKAALGVALGALVTPIIAVAAMSERRG